MSGEVKKYYDGFGEKEWERLESAPGQLEFEINGHFIKMNLKPSSTILDLGGGPGRYSIFLAHQGHRVYLADLSPELIRIGKIKIQEAGLDGVVCGTDVVDARQLSKYLDKMFDAVVALGPFYHLINKSDQKKAALEIHRVLKPNGLVFVAAHTVYGWLNGLLERANLDPAQVPPGTFLHVLEMQTYFNPTKKGFTEGYFFQPSELASLFSDEGFEIIKIISSKGIAFGKEAELAKL